MHPVNTYSSAQGWERWQRAVDQAADLGVDALIAADVAVLGYAAKRHPRLNLHLSVQGSATNAAALALYHERYGIRSPASTLTNASCRKACGESTRPGGSST